MKNTNYLVVYMVYASLLRKSLFLAFGKSFFGFCKIFIPDVSISSDTVSTQKSVLENMHWVPRIIIAKCARPSYFEISGPSAYFSKPIVT